MQPSEATGLHHQVPSNPSPYSGLFSMTHNNTTAFKFNQLFSNPSYNFQIPSQAHEINPQSSYFRSNSTSDDADEHLILINERKQRRLISNRESARRSRMRKKKHLDELWSQVIRLQSENHQLMDKLNHVSECHDQVLQENAQLKEEASELRQMLNDMQLNSP